MHRLEPNPDIVCSPLADGGVLFDLATKQYYALNAAGMIVWQQVEDGSSIPALQALIQQRYRTTDADTGLDAFAESLVSLGLAEARAAALENDAMSADGPADAASFEWPASWAPPSVTPHGRPLAKVILSPFDPTVPVPE